MQPNPYESPAHGAIAAKANPRTAGSLIRIGWATALVGLLVFIGLTAFLNLYLGYAPFWFQLAGFVSLAMVPIGALIFTSGLVWWATIRFRGQK